MNEHDELNKTFEQEEDDGATMIEYALLVALIAIIALASIRYLGLNVSEQFSLVSDSL